MNNPIYDFLEQSVKHRRLKALTSANPAYEHGVLNVGEENSEGEDDYLPHNPIVIEENICNIDDYQSGNIITKKDALIVDDGEIDFPATYSDIETKIDGFYNMPVLDINSDDSREILYSVFEEFSNERKERYVVNTRKQEESHIVDVDSGLPTQVYFSLQLRLDCDLTEKESETGKTLDENINNILREIKQPV